MRISRMVHVTTCARWRAWLEKHHDDESEIWLVYNKKASGLPRVAYDDAVEEALCFGWIDGIAKPIDEYRYSQRFTPRKEKSNWSELNRRRFRKLVKEGRMTPAEMVRRPKGRAMTPRRAPPVDAIPGYVRQALEGDRPAKQFFDGLAPSYRRLYGRWIESAKREETRQKRLREAISLLARKRKLGLK
jgi:uncharacterized protein YdeI (YjbR/CyaY-like superfamily)